MSEAIKLLIGTRKGAWTLRSDTAREAWALDGPLFLGHFVADPHRPEVMLMAASTGHLGPTILRSQDGGATWTEATRPPAFPKGDPQGRAGPFLLARTGAPQRAGRLVGREISARPVPQRRRRVTPGTASKG